jgi:Ricin-type beta-trefoil lectin domain
MRRYLTEGATGTRRAGRIAAAVGVMVVAMGLPTASTSNATEPAGAAARAKTVEAYVTYYGWYDNTPPGCATAYAGCVNGTGTYKDPITFASDIHEFPVGTLVYYPTVKKYFRMRDDCTECDADWTEKGPDGGPRLRHLDLWLGGKGGKEWDVIRCEDALTQARSNGSPRMTPVIVNPPPGLPTSREPLFGTSSGRCFGGAQDKTAYGRYQNKRTHECLTHAGLPRPGVSVVLARCSKAASQDLAFDGAFFEVGKLCLAARAQRSGSRLLFVYCSGRPRQLWEIGNGGTISTVEAIACIAEVRGIVELSGCKTAATNRGNQWTFVPERKPHVSY